MIPGEGSVDEQTLQGKGPYGVAYKAEMQGLPVIGIAGKVPLSASKEMNEYFDALIAIGDEPSDILPAIQAPEIILKWALKKRQFDCFKTMRTSIHQMKPLQNL